MLRQTLNTLPIDFEALPFPKELDSRYPNHWKHDFVFFRDLYVSNQKGDVVVARFREKERQAEEIIIEDWLYQQDVQVHTLPSEGDYFIEGGEFYFCPTENILFAGESRNSPKGNEKTAKLLNVGELIILKANAFHLDTLFTPVFNQQNELCLLIVCTQLLDKDSKIRLRDFSKKRGIQLLEIPPEEAIGLGSKLGSFAVNCLSLPGHLVGPTHFKTATVISALEKRKIKHSVVPLSQFRLSGGAVHCLTNELLFNLLKTNLPATIVANTSVFKIA